ncbi:MAG TPA: DUF309 domain-containing protein [Nitrospira sp.]|nr:DUF309 domain-containing protein [Nitrospira sp.]
MGIDLFNFGYWWESHEQFEALWHAFGHHTREGSFFKGLIQLAAACIKGVMNNPAAASRLLKNASMALKQAPSHCMGLNTDRLIEDMSRIDVAGGEISIYLLLEPMEVAPPSTMSGPPKT